jgi:His-Xaa-Ser system protein HxsD
MYSEQVVRKSLYWLSELSGWELSDDAASWIVNLHSDSAEATTTLHRLLNDFLLRESIDRTTKGLRARVISAALKKLGKGV